MNIFLCVEAFEILCVCSWVYMAVLLTGINTGEINTRLFFAERCLRWLYAQIAVKIMIRAQWFLQYRCLCVVDNWIWCNGTPAV